MHSNRDGARPLRDVVLRASPTVAWIRGSLYALLVCGATACASLPADWGRADVARTAADHGRALPAPADAAAFIATRLQPPLTADGVVQLALLNNPDLRQKMAALGVAAADVYEAGRLANPVISATRLSAGGADSPHAQLTLGIAFNFVDLLFLRADSRYAQTAFQAARLDASAAVLELAAHAESAWYRAAAAERVARMRERASEAAQLSADLSQRYFEAGNISRRELAQEQAAATRARIDAVSARAAAADEHVALNRIMGLDSSRDHWRLDTHFPLPPAQSQAQAQSESLPALRQIALDSRLDVAAARARSQALAERYHLVRHTRWVGGVEIGAERERDFNGAVNAGPTLSLQLPLFDWGAGRAARAQAQLDQSEAALDALVLDVDSQLRLALTHMQAAQVADRSYRDELIPQREAVVTGLQQEVNAMISGVFELIAAKQDEIAAYAGDVDAARDYWVARAELSRAIGRSLPVSADGAPAADAVDDADAEDADTDQDTDSKEDANTTAHDRNGAP